MRLLDLFSGTHSVGKVAQELGFDVTSLDLHGADINQDVLTWDYTKYPQNYFDIVWASPPCDTFSMVKRTNIGRNGYTHESVERDMLGRGVPILRKTEEIIDYFSPRLWFIENPDSGRMKDFIILKYALKYYVVDYCKYSDWGYRKRTRIWTNKLDFVPRTCNKDCGYVVGNRHVKQATGVSKGRSGEGQGGGSNRLPRYKIPPDLIRELLTD
eukprot:5151391-Prymnesium_polylepis.2